MTDKELHTYIGELPKVYPQHRVEIELIRFRLSFLYNPHTETFEDEEEATQIVREIRNLLH